MPGWLTHFSYVGITVILILTGAGLPVPEEVPIIAAGVASAHQQLHPGLAWLACLAGALLGDCLMYAIGYHFGRGLLRRRNWFSRTMTPEREQQIEVMIARHGWKVFLVARFLVGLRSPIYITAGILHVPFRRFLLIDSLVATTVVSTFFWISYFYAPYIPTLWQWIHNSQFAVTGILIVAGLAVGGYLWWRHRQRHHRPTHDTATRNSEAFAESEEDEESLSQRKTAV